MSGSHSGCPPGARLLETFAGQVIVEEPAAWHGGKARYPLYDESFGEPVGEGVNADEVFFAPRASS